VTPLLSWLLAAIPVFAAALVKIITALGNYGEEHRLERQVARHADLLAKLPEEAYKASLVELVNKEVAALAAQTEARLYRRVDGGNVAAMVVVMSITTALVWLLWWIDPAQRWLNTVLNVAAVVVGSAGFGFATIGGLGNLYKDTRMDQPEALGSAEQEAADTATAAPPKSERNGSRRRQPEISGHRP
jgi:hypothetical protein